MPDYSANEFTAFYEMLNSMKHSNPALDADAPVENTQFVKASNPDVLTFTRTNGDNIVTVIVNLSNESVPLSYPGHQPIVTGLTNMFTGSDAELPATLAPWQYLVFTGSPTLGAK